MSTAPYPQVTNELLSAYIDEAVSEEERHLVESAVAQDPDVAWRLESLRATVRLLRELPALPLPRSFLLTPEQVSQPAPAIAAATAAAVRPAAPKNGGRPTQTASADGFWQGLWRGWAALWQGGSPALRNAMAASFAVLLFLLVGTRFLAPPALPGVGQVQTVASQEAAPAAADMPAAVSASEEVAVENEGAPAIAGAVAPTVVVQPGAADTGAAVEGYAEPSAKLPETPVEGDAASSMTAADAADMTTNDVASSAASDVASAPEEAAAVEAPAAAEAAPAEAGPAAMLPTVLAAPAPALESAPPMDGAGGSSSSVLDDMQRQAGGSAPAPAAAVEESAGMTLAAAVPAAEAGEAAAASGPAAGQAPAVEPAEEEQAAAAVEATTAAAALSTEPSPLATAALAAAPVEIGSEAGDAAAANVATAPEAAPAATVAATEAIPPAPLALALQAFTALAAVATLIFALLWWRSRRPA